MAAKKKPNITRSKKPRATIQRIPSTTNPRALSRYVVTQDEAASLLTDYVRQYVGAVQSVPTPSSGVVINQDLIFRTESYNGRAGYDLYDDVEADPHIASVLTTRKLAVAGLDWHIVPATDDARDAQIADTIDELLRDVIGFSQDLIELGDANGKGFSVAEVMWDTNPEGFIIPKELINRPQRRFQFDAATRWPKVRKYTNQYYGDPVPPMKFIVHRNSQKYESPFGDPLDQKLFWMWLFKKFVIKFWMQHQEVAAGPIPIVKIPTNATQGLKDEANNVVQNIRSGAYGVIPDNFELVWGEAKNALSTTQGYESFIRFVNDEITKCVLGQLLTTEGSSSTGKGSNALGNVHNTVRRDYLEYDAKSLAGTLSSTLIKWIVDLNFAGVKRYPKFEFILDEPVDVQLQTLAIKNLSDAGYRVDETYIEEELGIPLKKDAQGNAITKGTQNENPTSIPVAGTVAA